MAQRHQLRRYGGDEHGNRSSNTPAPAVKYDQQNMMCPEASTKVPLDEPEATDTESRSGAVSHIDINRMTIASSTAYIISGTPMATGDNKRAHSLAARPHKRLANDPETMRGQ